MSSSELRDQIDDAEFARFFCASRCCRSNGFSSIPRANTWRHWITDSYRSDATGIDVSIDGELTGEFKGRKEMYDSSISNNS